jgi:flagellar basal body-associated protein FliL
MKSGFHSLKGGNIMKITNYNLTRLLLFMFFAVVAYCQDDLYHAHAQVISPALVSIKPIVTNIQDKYVKISIECELTDSNSVSRFKSDIDKLTESFTSKIKEKSVNELETIEGKKQLKDELILLANEHYGETIVKNLYFTTFAIE